MTWETKREKGERIKVSWGVGNIEIEEEKHKTNHVWDRMAEETKKESGRDEGELKVVNREDRNTGKRKKL